MGLHEVHELYDAGFNLHQLKAAGYTVVDLNSACSISINGSALEVACPPPGIGAKI